MSDYISCRYYFRELAEKLPGSQLQKIFQPDEFHFIFRFRMPGENCFLTVSMNPDEPALYPLPSKFSTGAVPSSFCMQLRKHLSGGSVINVNPVEGDRILIITISRSHEPRNLVIELTGRGSNLLITDSSNRYIGAFTRKDPTRKIITGQPYEFPPPPAKLDPTKAGIQDLEKILNEPDVLDLNPEKFLFEKILGMTKDYAREIIKAAGVEQSRKISEITGEKLTAYLNSAGDFFEKARSEPLPVLYYEKEDENMEGPPMVLSPWPLEIYKEYPAEKPDTMGDALQGYYKNRMGAMPEQDSKNDLTLAVKKQIKKVERRLEKQHQDMERAEKSLSLQKIGELLLGNLHAIKEKSDKAELLDYYQDPPEKMVIELDPSKSASDNAQEYFKKVRKAKRGLDIIAERILISEEELEFLKGILDELHKCEDPDTIEHISALLKERDIFSKQTAEGRGKGGPPSGPRKIILGNGYIALVGRNSRQNDELVTKTANRDDIWFHARDIPGSHLILKIQKPSNPVPDQVIHRAAALAAYYSKGKTSSNVPVSYTRMKNVRKHKGQKAGKVFFTNEKTLYVNPEYIPEQ